MSEYKLRIEIPLGLDEKKANYKSHLIIQDFLRLNMSSGPNLIKEKYGFSEVLYKVSNEKTKPLVDPTKVIL